MELSRRAFLQASVAGAAVGWAVVPRTPRAAGLGDELYDVVSRYARRRHHRTGTAPERSTTRWFARELARRGGEVELVGYDFPRFAARCVVEIGGQRVDSMPLFYEWTGRVITEAPATGALEVTDNAFPLTLEDLIADAAAAGAPALVLATTSNAANGHVVAINRPATIGSGLPVVLVAGDREAALATGPVQVRADASLVPGRASNVWATFGPPALDPVLITTPLSGWYRCAGERGSGVAIALRLAERLAPIQPTAFLGTSGHELAFLGLQQFLAQRSLAPRLIVHVGASVAAGSFDAAGTFTLSATRWSAENLDEATGNAVATATATAGFTHLHAPASFLGEGATWQTLGVPLLSFAGTFPLFHTAADTPESTVTPDALALVSQAVEQAALEMLA